jgi:hypothetical protein
MDDFNLSDWDEGCLAGFLFTWSGGFIAGCLCLVILIIYLGWFH